MSDRRLHDAYDKEARRQAVASMEKAVSRLELADQVTGEQKYMTLLPELRDLCRRIAETP